MCCAITCLIKCIFNIVASILMTIGIVLAIIGALLLWGFDVIVKGISPIQNQISQFLAKLGINANVEDVMNMMATNANMIGSVAFAIGLTLMAFSIVMVFVMCCCTMRCILIVITVLLIVLTLALLVFVCYFGADPTNRLFKPLERYLQNDIINQYEGIKSANVKSIFVNAIQISVHCCGLIGYKDFSQASNFNRTVTLGNGSVIQIPFPMSCCNYKTDFTIDKYEMDNCLYYQASDTKDKGCWTTIKPYLESFFKKCITTMGITIGILVAVIVCLILLVICLGKVP